MIKNNRISIALTLLIICLIASLSTVSAGWWCTCDDRYNLDGPWGGITVKQGENITAHINVLKPAIIGVGNSVSYAPIIFTLIDQNQQIITEQKTKTGKNTWILNFKYAVFQYNTTNMNPGDYRLKVVYNHPPCPEHPEKHHHTERYYYIKIKP